jgi:hypothetical protein
MPSSADRRREWYMEVFLMPPSPWRMRCAAAKTSMAVTSVGVSSPPPGAKGGCPPTPSVPRWRSRTSSRPLEGAGAAPPARGAGSGGGGAAAAVVEAVELRLRAAPPRRQRSSKWRAAALASIVVFFGRAKITSAPGRGENYRGCASLLPSLPHLVSRGNARRLRVQDGPSIYCYCACALCVRGPPRLRLTSCAYSLSVRISCA